MLLNSSIRRALTVFPALWAVLAVPNAVGLAQQRPALAGEKSGLRLTISADQSGYHVGDSIKIATDFRNVSDGRIRIIVDRPIELFNRFSVVRVNSITPVELTPAGKERLDLMRSLGSRSSMLTQNEALEYSFEISAWYVMPPGTYKVACYIDMATDTTFRSRLRYVSNELTITIAP
jgi:hypothetical protein